MSVAELRRTLAHLAEVPEPALRAACKAVETIAAQEGGSVVLGRKRRKVKLKAITRIKPEGNKITATVHGVPTGPWVWKTSGTARHNIPKRKPTARKPRPMYASGYEHPIQHMQIEHHGTTGRGAWDTVIKRARKIVPQIIGERISAVIRSG